MKPYSEYTAEELAMERLFIRWVRNPDDPAIGKFWTHWLEQHPHRASALAQARQLVEALSDWSEPGLTGQEAASLWQQIRVTASWLPDLEQLDSKVFAFRRWSVGIAATVMLILLWSLWQPRFFLPDRPEAGLVKADSTQGQAKSDSIASDTVFKLK